MNFRKVDAANDEVNISAVAKGRLDVVVLGLCHVNTPPAYDEIAELHNCVLSKLQQQLR